MDRLIEEMRFLEDAVKAHRAATDGIHDDVFGVERDASEQWFEPRAHADHGQDG